MKLTKTKLIISSSITEFFLFLVVIKEQNINTSIFTKIWENFYFIWWIILSITLLGMWIYWGLRNYKERILEQIKKEPDHKIIDQLLIHKFVCRIRDLKEIKRDNSNNYIRDVNIENEKTQLMNNSQISLIFPSLDERKRIIDKYFENLPK